MPDCDTTSFSILSQLHSVQKYNKVSSLSESQPEVVDELSPSVSIHSSDIPLFSEEEDIVVNSFGGADRRVSFLCNRCVLTEQKKRKKKKINRMYDIQTNQKMTRKKKQKIRVFREIYLFKVLWHSIVGTNERAPRGAPPLSGEGGYLGRSVVRSCLDIVSDGQYIP